MNTSIRIKLSLMMFLEFFIWGGWFVTLGTFLGNNLGADGGQIGQAYSTQSWGAIIAPFIIGLIADRFFNAEKILGVLHLLGAGLMYMMSTSGDFSNFYPLVLGYMIIYMPTLALVNSVAFKQMTDPTKEFAHVRLWGTVGWIVAGLAISFALKWDSTAGIESGMLSNTFLMTAIASAILGFLSFTLPATPPQSTESKSVSDILGLDALKLLADRNFFIFFLSSILICIPLAFYYAQANPFLVESKISNPTGLMTIGQVSEVLMMLLLPFFFKKFGFKMTLLFGMLAWVLRYFLFAYGGGTGVGFFMVLMGIALHGICYDFFFVSGQIYTDSKAGEKIKSAAQGLITLATYGLGMYVGFYITGKITDANLLTDGATHNWNNVWTFPALFAAGVMVFFFIFFKNEEIEYKE